MPELVAGTDIIITEALGIDSIYINVDSGNFLTSSSSFGGDVSGTYDNLSVNLSVANDSHTHEFNNLTGKTSGTGNYTTTGVFTGGSVVSSSDAFVNSLTLGKGGGNVSTNTAVGASALFSNEVGGNFNSAFGNTALFSNTTGDSNVAVGDEALFTSTTGSRNTALGAGTLYFNTTGSNNTAVGAYVLYENTTGVFNSALGRNSLGSNTSGTENSSFGNNSMSSNTVGTGNSALGYNSLSSNSTGNNNTAVGTLAGANLTSGNNVTLIGYDAQPSNFSVSNEITLGDTNVTSFRVPGIDLTVDTSDLVYGGNLLPSTTLTYNLGSSDSRWNDLYLSSSSIYFGSEVVTASDSKLYINGSVVSSGPGASLSYLSDGSGETISSGSIVPSTTLTYDLGSSDSRWNDLYLSGSSLYLGDSVLSSSDGILLSNQSFEVDGNITATGSITSLSDASRKTDIENIIDPLSIVNQLSGVYFKFIDDEEGRRQVGLIAQDTEPVLPEVVFDHTDGFKSVSYGNLVAVLIEAIKELSDEVDKLKQIT